MQAGLAAQAHHALEHLQRVLRRAPPRGAPRPLGSSGLRLHLGRVVSRRRRPEGDPGRELLDRFGLRYSTPWRARVGGAAAGGRVPGGGCMVAGGGGARLRHAALELVKVRLVEDAAVVALARAGVPPRGGREVAYRRGGGARRDEAGVRDAEARRAALLAALRLDGAHELARDGRDDGPAADEGGGEDEVVQRHVESLEGEALLRPPRRAAALLKLVRRHHGGVHAAAVRLEVRGRAIDERRERGDERGRQREGAHLARSRRLEGAACMARRGETGILGAALRQDHGLSVASETLGLFSRVRRTAPSLEMRSDEQMVARSAPTKTAL